jgi:hypothetical protein
MFIGRGVNGVLNCGIVLTNNDGSAFCGANDVGSRGSKASWIGANSGRSDDGGSDIGRGDRRGAWMVGKYKGEGDGDEGISGGGSRDELKLRLILPISQLFCLALPLRCLSCTLCRRRHGCW